MMSLVLRCVEWHLSYIKLLGYSLGTYDVKYDEQGVL